MTYYLNGSQCTFTEMLGAYVANSTAKEEHMLGMVVGLVERHLRRLEPTPAQCRTITADTQGRIRFADGGEAAVNTGLIASGRSSVPGSLAQWAAEGGRESISAEAKIARLSTVRRSSLENSLSGSRATTETAPT
jgi:hypothetical protein